MAKVAGVVTLYNPDSNITENINSYLDKIKKLYVVDNSELSNKSILPDNKKIEYIFNGENLGVAKALNIAANKAIAEGYDWLLTMDQDSRFAKKDIDLLIDYINKNKDEKIGLISPWHKTKTIDKKPSKKIEDVVEVMTSGNLINLKAYKEIGGYDDDLFIDAVDFDYCMNLNVHNYKVRRLNYCELEHELGDITIKKFLGHNFVCSNHNYLRRYYMARNDHYIYDRYNTFFPEYCEMIINGLKGQFKNILFFEKDKVKKLRNIIRGYKDYKKGIKGKYPYEN